MTLWQHSQKVPRFVFKLGMLLRHPVIVRNRVKWLLCSLLVSSIHCTDLNISSTHHLRVFISGVRTQELGVWYDGESSRPTFLRCYFWFRPVIPDFPLLYLRSWCLGKGFVTILEKETSLSLSSSPSFPPYTAPTSLPSSHIVEGRELSLRWREGYLITGHNRVYFFLSLKRYT